MSEPTPDDGKNSNSLSLSEALLAPLNSIFEAQIHASRAFLNFFLQMGFRHKYTPDDIVSLNKNPEENKDILDQIKNEADDRKEIESLSVRIQELQRLEQMDSNQKNELSTSTKRLKELKVKWGDLYQQTIEYYDQNGNERVLSIPNLSLLPIKPLAIQNANFKFELRVKDDLKSAGSPIRTAKMANTKRPWFLVDDPKTIQGEFVPQQQENSTDKTIKIDVTIGSVDMPYGLYKLISSLTNTAEDNEKTKPNNQ